MSDDTMQSLPAFAVRSTGLWFGRGNDRFHINESGLIDFTESDSGAGVWKSLRGIVAKVDQDVVLAGKLAECAGVIGMRLEEAELLLDQLNVESPVSRQAIQFGAVESIVETLLNARFSVVGPNSAEAIEEQVRLLTPASFKRLCKKLQLDAFHHLDATPQSLAEFLASAVQKQHEERMLYDAKIAEGEPVDAEAQRATILECLEPLMAEFAAQRKAFFGSARMTSLVRALDDLPGREAALLFNAVGLGAHPSAVAYLANNVSERLADFANPYHDRGGKFTRADHEEASTVIPSQEHHYRKRDLHESGEWPEVRPTSSFMPVSGKSLRVGETAHSADGSAYLVTQSASSQGMLGAGLHGSGLHGSGKEAMGRRLDDSGKPQGKELPMRGDFHVEIPPREVKKSYGGVLFNEHGQVLLREPANHFDNYVWTFAKGGQSPGEHHVDTAIKEVAEETGHSGKIVGHVPGVFQSSSTSSNYYYLMHTKGHDATKMDDETWQTRWVHPEKAKELIGLTTNAKGRERDLKVLEAATRAYRNLQNKTAPLRLRGAAVPESQPAFSEGDAPAAPDYEGDFWSNYVVFEDASMQRLDLLWMLMTRPGMAAAEAHQIVSKAPSA